jgi:hypothetical protein
MAKPYYSLSKAVAQAPAGTVIYMRGGTFKYSATIAQPYGGDNRGLLLTGDYWRITGLEISHAGDNGVKLDF